MKCAIIIADDHKQVMFTPETESEKEALEILRSAKDDDLQVVYKYGSVFPGGDDRIGFHIAMNESGYLRAFQDNNSLLLLIKPKSSNK